MSFSEAQREQIRQYLGYDATEINADLEAKIDLVGATATKQATVEALLVGIAAIELSLGMVSASGSFGSPKKADELEWYDVRVGASAGTSLTQLEYGQLLVQRLAARLDLDTLLLPSEYFGPSGTGGGAVVTLPRRWV